MVRCSDGSSSARYPFDPAGSPALPDAALMRQFAVLLANLEQHMRAQAKAAQEVAILVAEAERLAHRARHLATVDRRGTAAAVDEIRAKLDAFLNEVAIVTATASEVARINEILANRLSGHCQRLQSLAEAGDPAARKAEVRAELGRMANTMEAIVVGRRRTGGRWMQALAKAAAGLALFGDQLFEGGLRAVGDRGCAFARAAQLRGPSRRDRDHACAHSAAARSAIVSTAAHTTALASGRAPGIGSGSMNRVGEVVRTGERAAQKGPLAPQIWSGRNEAEVCIAVRAGFSVRLSGLGSARGEPDAIGN